MLDLMKAIKGESLYVQAKHVITTINNFMASADEFITSAHAPKFHIDDKSGRRKEVPHDMQMVRLRSFLLLSYESERHLESGVVSVSSFPSHGKFKMLTVTNQK